MNVLSEKQAITRIVISTDPIGTDVSCIQNVEHV